MSAPLDSLRGQLALWVQAVESAHRKPPGFRFSCLEDLLLRHGVVYAHHKTLHPVRPRQCFRESYWRATRPRSQWIYVEGFAMSAIGFGVHHAWVTRADAPSSAFELAWGDADAETTAYLGVPIRAEYVRKVHTASPGRRYYGTFAASWLRYPVLTGITPIEEIIYPALNGIIEQKKDKTKNA